VILNNFAGNSSPVVSLLQSAAEQKKTIVYSTAATAVDISESATIGGVLSTNPATGGFAQRIPPKRLAFGAALGAVLDKKKTKEKCL
jgi:hypothetical protein